MQIIGIDHSETGLRCARIQNIEKPEFAKLKQFPANNKGVKAMEDWIDECCSKDHASMQIALIVEDQNGAAIAWRSHNAGYAVIPMTYAGIRGEFTKREEKRTPAEIIARKAVTWKQRWTPYTQVQLELRNAILEREIARTAMLENQARNQAYQNEAFDFLIQLTRNASSIHENRMIEAENTIRTVVEKSAEIKSLRDMIMTIPGMSDMTAAVMAFVMSAYPSNNAEQFCRMLGLHDGKAVRKYNYRAPELRILRNELYEMAMTTGLDLDPVSDLLDRLSDKGKSEKTIYIALSHKIAKIAFAVASKKQAYKA